MAGGRKPTADGRFHGERRTFGTYSSIRGRDGRLDFTAVVDAVKQAPGSARLVLAYVGA
jgi:hypothetical protein